MPTASDHSTMISSSLTETSHLLPFLQVHKVNFVRYNAPYMQSWSSFRPNFNKILISSLMLSIFYLCVFKVYAYRTDSSTQSLIISSYFYTPPVISFHTLCDTNAGMYHIPLLFVCLLPIYYKQSMETSEDLGVDVCLKQSKLISRLSPLTAVHLSK